MNSINALCIVLLTGLVLSGCGGGGGGGSTTTPFQLPFTCSNTATSIDGCWVSELCSTNAGAAGTHLVEVINQTATGPNAGDVTTWLVDYANDQCSGDPIAATNINTLASFTESYEEGVADANVCTDMAGDPMVGIACTDLDISVTSGGITSTGYTTYVIEDTDTRVCFPLGDYNYDNTGNGGLGLPIETDSFNRPTEINFSALSCLVRFTI
jgi:hypothetical protein